MKEPVGLDQALRELLSRLGLPEPETMDRIRDEWPEVAGRPWDEKTTPIFLRSGVLHVEAVDNASLGLLRYGVDGLTERLSATYGSDVISSVELRPPGRRRSTPVS